MADVQRFQSLLAFMKADLLFACCWPLRPTATRCQIICNKIFRWFSVLHSLIMLVMMVYTLYNNCANLFLMMQLICSLWTTLSIPMQIFCYAMQYDRLQYVIYELEDYCMRASLKESEVLHRYIDSCKPVYIGSICAFTITVLLSMISPIIEPHPFPLGIQYPFDVNYQPLKTIIYLHQVLILYQAYIQACSNIFVALLLWFVSARCEILSERFRAVRKLEELRMCVVEHQELLRYGKEVTLSVRYVILTSLTISTLLIIFTGCTFLGKQSMNVKSRYLIFFISSFAKVYLCAWPADYLLNKSMSMMHAAYDSLWYNKEIGMQKNLINILLRSQYPIIVQIPCMLPTISLNYYASYVWTAFSYLTTFRAFLADDDN